MSESESEPAVARWDEESLWRFVSARGMDRRQFLRLMMVGGAAAVIAACTGADSPIGTSGPSPGQASSNASAVSPWFKETTPFFVHDDKKSLEARLENMQGLITPNRLFFVRTTPSVWTWTLPTGDSRWKGTAWRIPWS